ncbi:class I adenylate-forming enzyme family protein [Actinokineospora enzanensis]|uniref:class I adenylate-forming enzyme family protein n=1 Tax=Actinokineospora enzanensis TaxID=155975 RepID=UPI000476DEE0|nr:class I adenylate-forming enzyme family protein [Actinokineospora enzanensis]
MSTGVVTGESLDVLGGLVGGPRTDDVLRAAAVAAPDAVALVSPAGTLTYAEFDLKVDALAAALRERVGQGAVIALTAALDESFAVGYFAIARSGNISALINPLLRPDGYTHVLRTSGARLAIVVPSVYLRVAEVFDRLPELGWLVLTHRVGEELPEAETVRELVTAATPSSDEPDAGPDDVACLQFTSGTTGAPKAVRLSHRNLTVNAAQVAHSHRLDPYSVLVNYLPTFHLMHLTAGVAARATHVLCPGDDPVVAIETAARYRATHFYSLPVRLSRLAVDPRLSGLTVPTLRAILSGGSSLPGPATLSLSQQFGVPVVQGYGLAETSPLTNSENLDRWKLGSSGPPVPGTSVRVVDVATRAVLPVGGIGEIEVVGPQLMQGYLGRDLATELTADGWFATGDIGRVDADGHLFVVDRIKDVFKCDNWLVSPSEIERVVLRHPGVADCVVVDYPDEFSGAVACGVIVPRGADFDPEDLRSFVAARTPYYENLRHITLVDAIPRSPNGKVQRRAVRDSVLGTS